MENSSIIQEINKYKDIPLSGDDILKLVDGRANIVRYPNVHKYYSIDDLLRPYGACVLLYEAQPHSGHWCVLTLHGRSLEFFDPYGGFPDSQLNHVYGDQYKYESHQDRPYLSHLLLKCNYNMSYNEHKFQKLAKNVKDCGRWCSLRILFKYLNLKQFKQLFYGPYSDDLATFLTANYSQLERVD